MHISKCLTVQNIPPKLPLGRKTRLPSSLMALWLNVLDGLLAIYWYLGWFAMLLITSVALSKGSEWFLETRGPGCPDGVNDSQYLWTSLIFFPSCCFSHRCHIDHPEKKSKGIFHQITKTHGTVICVSTGVVLLLLILSILVQVKQPRKKVIKTSNN